MKFTAKAVRFKHAFVPDDLEAFEKIPDDATVMIEYIRNRNYENHKRFFAFIRDTFDMQDFFDDQEIYRKWLVMKSGYFQTVVTPKGETIFLPESIAFEKMDESEFKEMFSKCIDVFVSELGTKVTEQELYNIVLGYG